MVMTPHLLSTFGVDVLGTAIGCREYRREFLQKAVDHTNKSIRAFKDMSKQSALLLLRQCLLPSLTHVRRNLLTNDLVDVWRGADALVLTELLRLMASPSSDHYCLDALRSLPLKLGGLGLPAFEAIQKHAFLAANSVAGIILPDLRRVSKVAGPRFFVVF